VKTKYIKIILLISLVFLVVLLLVRKIPNTIEIVMVTKGYNFVQVERDETFEISFFISTKNSNFSNQNNIKSIAITDEINYLKFKLEDIILSEEKVYLKNKWYYNVLFSLKPLIEVTNNFTLEMIDAYLEIAFKNDSYAKLSIGSFSYYLFQENSQNLSITKLKGLVNTFNNNKRLVGVLIGIKNNTNKQIKITNIYPLDLNIKVAYKDIIKCNDFIQGETIKEILGYDYNLFEIEENVKLNLCVDDEIRIFIPLKYIKDIVINKMGFLIEYELDKETFYYCLDDFLFFESNDYLVNLKWLKFYTYEDS